VVWTRLSGTTPNNQRIRIYNNTIYNSGGIELSDFDDGPVLRNNLLDNTAGFIGSTAPNIDSDYNFFAPTGYSGDGSHSIVQTSTSGIFANPSGGDFHLVPGSLAIGKGANLSATGFATDITGTPRPPGAAWDIGSYQMTPAGPPSITLQPANQTVNVGSPATFSVVATGTGPLTYQWYKNGGIIPGATSSIYTTPAAVPGDSGSTFAVVVNDAVGRTVTSATATLIVTVHAFTMVDRGGVSVISAGSGNLSAGYARILATSGTTPSGIAIFDERVGGILVTEAGVPASFPLQNGRIYAELVPAGFSGQGTDIGLAIANPSTQTAAISFYYTRSDGTDAGSGTYNLGAGLQVASFLDQSPWNVPFNFQGTFTFSSNVPISIVALQLYYNQRGEALITTLPVVDTTIAPGATPAVLSHFTDGAGWTTAILLVNPTDTPMSGTIQFRGQNGLAVTPITANGQSAASFNYTVPRRSSFKLQTAGTTSFQAGSVTVTPASGSSTPVPLAVLSYATGGNTVTQAGVPSNSGTAFRMFVEALPGWPTATIGAYSSGFAVANASSTAATLTFNLYTLAGVDTGFSNTVQVPAFGQTAAFIEDIFSTMPLPFQGIFRVSTSSSSISVVSLRIRYNERHDFLMTTIPPTNEATTTTTAEADFPHFVNGGGFTTQFVLFSGSAGQTSSGDLKFFKQDGTSFSLNVN
jgi:hypothetical protein